MIARLPHKECISVDSGSGSSSQTSNFTRSGTSTKTGGFSLPPDMIGEISRSTSALDLSSSDPHASFVNSLLTRNNNSVPDSSGVTPMIGREASNFPWYNTLLSIATKDPYSSDYEASTEEAFITRLNNTLAQLDSANVRGGENHAGLVKGQAISDAMMQRGQNLATQRATDVGAQAGASQLLTMLEQMVGGSSLDAFKSLVAARGAQTGQALEAGNQRTQRGAAHAGALSTVGRQRGAFTESVTDALSGSGSQNGQQWTDNAAYGLSCCWTFLEALDGKLPEVVYLGRAYFRTGNRRLGYKAMSKVLVPLMKRCSWVKKMVRAVLVRPFEVFGNWYFEFDNSRGRRWGWLATPVCYTWLLAWSVIGRLYAK